MCDQYVYFHLFKQLILYSYSKEKIGVDKLAGAERIC